jgi:hypothetical protein
VREFTFALDGECGESIELTFEISHPGAPLESYPITLQLGVVSPDTIEDFENEGNLPLGWSSSSEDNGTGWAGSSARSASGSFSAFAANESSLGASFLVSPAFAVDLDGGTISFEHYYHTETGFDGGALEISIDGGPWQDIIAAGGSFTAGGYDSTLNNTSNYLSRRQAWTGDSAGFITTTLNLPASATHKSVQLRWVMASDSIIAREGWYIDNVSRPSPLECDTTGPAFEITATSTDLLEDEPLLGIELTVSSRPRLPTASPISITLETSGSADSTDISDLTNLTIGIGESFVSRTIFAIEDTEIEGPETLTLDLTGALAPLDINIADTPYAEWAFALGEDNLLADQDFDHDGSLNIEEFAFGTTGNDPASKPNKQPTQEGDTIKVPAPTMPLPDGMTVILELSENLEIWSSDDVTVTPGFFEFQLGDAQLFYRFAYIPGP